jgi:hypothetical protein
VFTDCLNFSIFATFIKLTNSILHVKKIFYKKIKSVHLNGTFDRTYYHWYLGITGIAQPDAIDLQSKKYRGAITAGTCTYP